MPQPAPTRTAVGCSLALQPLKGPHAKPHIANALMCSRPTSSGKVKEAPFFCKFCLEWIELLTLLKNCCYLKGKMTNILNHFNILTWLFKCAGICILTNFLSKFIEMELNKLYTKINNPVPKQNFMKADRVNRGKETCIINLCTRRKWMISLTLRPLRIKAGWLNNFLLSYDVQIFSGTQPAFHKMDSKNNLNIIFQLQ